MTRSANKCGCGFKGQHNLVCQITSVSNPNTRNVLLCGGLLHAIHVGIDLSSIQRSMLRQATSAIYMYCEPGLSTWLERHSRGHQNAYMYMY